MSNASSNVVDFPAAVPMSPDMAGLLALIAALTQAIVEENGQLATGLPVSVAATDRKQLLSDRLGARWASQGGSAAVVLAAEPVMARRLLRAVTGLQRVADENLRRLDAALVASRRRIDAVMTVLNEAPPAATTANGRAV